jgi:hypothetical protein
MQIPFLLSLGLLLHPASAPDKFWMSEAPDAAVIEGSLLDEDATHYHLRVQGGEIWLLKARVLRIEKDGLSVEAIAQREQEAKDAKAAADKVADERAAAERVAVEPTGEPPAAVEADQRPGAATPAEASAGQAPPTEAGEPVPERFDPIRGRLVPGTLATRDETLRALAASYTATRDRSVLRQLRLLRRGR